MVLCGLFSHRLVTPRKLLLNLIYISVCFSLYLVIFRGTGNPSIYQEVKKNTTLAPVTSVSTTVQNARDTKSPNGTASHIKMCPAKSPHLVGAIRENLQNVSLEELEVILKNNNRLGAHSVMDLGGHFYPKSCTARQKLAVLIPFRNRHQHLPILLHNLIPILARQLLDFRIYVIEQEDGVTFNKGLLYNTGFISALEREKFDCVVFHDVDCLPLNDNIIYQCGDQPMHLLAAGSKWNFSLSYPQLNGGALMMLREQYVKINGYSNLYFGWGSEDDDIRSRLLRSRYKIVRYPKNIARYYQLKHERDEGNAENKIRFRLVRSKNRQKLEGLLSTVCKIRSIEVNPLFVWIRVSLNMTQVLQTAPKDLIGRMTELFNDAKRFDKLGLGHSELGDKLTLPP